MNEAANRERQLRIMRAAARAVVGQVENETAYNTIRESAAFILMKALAEGRDSWSFRASGSLPAKPGEVQVDGMIYFPTDTPMGLEDDLAGATADDS